VREVDGWELIEGGATGRARHVVLMLPGNLATGAFYQGMLDDPALAAAGVAALAATPPGFGGRPAELTFPFTVAAYALLIERMLQREQVDAVVAHSLSAQAMLDVAARGAWRGPLLLASPTLRARDEEPASRQLNRASRAPIVRTTAWWAMMRAVGIGMRDELPEDRRADLIAEMRRNANRVHRRWLIAGFDHLAEHGDLTGAVVAAARSEPVAVVRGEADSVRLPDELRDRLTTGGVHLVDVPDAGHFVIAQAPEQVNAVLLDLLSRGAAGA
jgi:pimeloyl-ACP methyl ester carboxylesterase